MVDTLVDHAPGTGAAKRRRSNASVQTCGMHGLASPWPLPRTTTTQLLGDRRWQGPGRRSDEMNNAIGQKTPPPRAASTVYFSVDDDVDVLAARPTPLVEVRPQAGGSAVHHGAHRRYLAARPDSRRACAAVGEPGGGIHADARHCDPRAGCRSAQALSRQNSAGFSGSSSAEGGTVGGSAHDRVLLFSAAADCRADHRHPSSRSWRWWWTGKSSRFFLRTEFNSTACEAERWHSSSWRWLACSP